MEDGGFIFSSFFKGELKDSIMNNIAMHMPKAVY